MNKNYYDIYIQNVIDLAKTLVIKSEYNALSLNSRIQELYGPNAVNSNDPRTWKYYLNISGEYHPKDTPMAIMSLDTLTMIPFTKTNLAIHTTTKAAYQYGSRYYRELVFQFPDNEDLIKGILYPVDINTAIDAEDLKVLTYPKFLVEENEISLISRIDDWIRYFSARWNNKQFVLSDTHYMAAFLGVLYLQLVPLIINLRLKACKTEEAHSYHVREYLASHGMLDVYLSQLTMKQSLFLYRNICYIERNNGKKEIFYWLIEKLLTDRDIPIDQYTMNHNNNQITVKYAPTAVFRKEPINYKGNDQYFSTDAILFKEDLLAPGNPEARILHNRQIEERFVNSKDSTLATKVLESSIVDLSTTDLISYHDVALNHWMYWSQTGKLNTYLQATNPQTGEKFSLHVKDAAIYFLYAFTQSLGINLNKVPEIVAARVLIEPKTTPATLEAFRDPQYIPQSYPSIISNYIPNISAQLSSIGNFQTTVRALHAGALKQLLFVAAQEHHTTRGYTYGMVLRMFGDKVIAPDTNQSFTSWLALKNIPFRNFTTKDWEFIYKDLFQVVTGESFNSTEELEKLQKTLIKLLQQLSSYSIQFITEINKKSVKALNWSAIRIGDINGAGRSYYRIYIASINILKQHFIAYSRFLLPIKDLIQRFALHLAPTKIGPMNPDVKVRDKIINTNIFIPVGDTNIDNRWFPEGNKVFKESDFPLFQAFFNMTAEQRKKVFDTFTTCFKPIDIPTKANLTRFILSGDLNSFNTWDIKDYNLQAYNYQHITNKTTLLRPSVYRIILDGLKENTFGSQYTPETFNYSQDSTAVNSFQFTGGEPIDVSSTTIGYSGNYTQVGDFEVGAGIDGSILILPDMVNIYSSHEIDISDISQTIIVDSQRNDISSTIILDASANSCISSTLPNLNFTDITATMEFGYNSVEVITDGMRDSYEIQIAPRYKNSYLNVTIGDMNFSQLEANILGVYNSDFESILPRLKNAYYTTTLPNLAYSSVTIVMVDTPVVLNATITLPTLINTSISCGLYSLTNTATTIILS
mgnify:CR=1 FL=1